MKCWHSDSRRDPSKYYETSIHHRTPSALPKIQHGLGDRNKVSWRIKPYYLYPLTTWPLCRSHYSFPPSPLLFSKRKRRLFVEENTLVKCTIIGIDSFYSPSFRLIIPQTNRTPTASTLFLSDFRLFFSRDDAGTLKESRGMSLIWREGTGGLSYFDQCFLVLLFLQIHTHTSSR